MRPFRQRLGSIILFLADIVILFFVTAAAVALREVLPAFIPDYPVFTRDISYAWWFFPVWITILAYEGAYTKRFTYWDEIKMLWKVSLFSSLAILSIVFIGKMTNVSRTVVVIIGIFALIVHPLLRFQIKRYLIAWGLLKRKVLILGANETGRLALRSLMNEPNLGYEVVGFLDDRPRTGRMHVDGVRVHGRLDCVERYLRNTDIHDIVIAITDLDKEALEKLIARLQHKALSILYFLDHAGLAVLGTELMHFFHDRAFALQIKNNLAEPLNYYTKRIFDYLVGGALFLLLLLPLAIIAIVVRATSAGPAIYWQQRVGRNGRVFRCFKFRTMYRDADERLSGILARDPAAQREWKVQHKLRYDPRITPVGDFLRRTSLDELPQILNVLRGDMSLVGPRPVTEEEIDRHYRENAKLCFSVLPGITGLWQVSGRSNTTYQYRISLDTWYVRNWNLWIDIVILLRTVVTVLRREGAR